MSGRFMTITLAHGRRSKTLCMRGNEVLRSVRPHVHNKTSKRTTGSRTPDRANNMLWQEHGEGRVEGGLKVGGRFIIKQGELVLQ